MNRTDIKAIRQKLQLQRDEILEFLRRLENETRSLDVDSGRDVADRCALSMSKESLFVLTAGLMHVANQRREVELLRMQVIEEMNHHIRNALAAISLTTDSIENHECIRVISDSVNRIEWALREVLPRNAPLQNEDRYFQPRTEERRVPGDARAIHQTVTKRRDYEPYRH